MQDLDITPKMARVLKVFLEDPSQPRYGFELMRLTGMASGSLYPMLARLEEAGLLTGGKEDIDPHAEGRPPRYTYTITGAAVTAVRLQLAALSEQYRPPRYQPAPGSGRTGAPRDRLRAGQPHLPGRHHHSCPRRTHQRGDTRLARLPAPRHPPPCACRLDPAGKITVYEDEWLPELTCILRGAEARPITRLIIGIKFSAGLLITANRIARHLHRTPSNPAQPIKLLTTGRVVAAADLLVAASSKHNALVSLINHAKDALDCAQQATAYYEANTSYSEALQAALHQELSETAREELSEAAREIAVLTEMTKMTRWYRDGLPSP